MTTIKDLSLGRSDTFQMDPRALKTKPEWNVRERTPELDAHIRWLADSIKAVGVKEPLTVYMEGDEPFVSNGHCRLDAALLAISEGCELKSVPCRTEERHASEGDRVLSMITRNSGKPLTPLEKSEVYKRLFSLGWDEKEIALKANVSVTHVSQRFFLSAAPQEVKNMVKTGEVAATTATTAIREHGTQAPAKLREAVADAKAAGKTKAVLKKTDKFRAALEEIRDIIAALDKSAHTETICDIDAIVAHNLA